MIDTGLVYVNYDRQASAFVGCGALVEGPFILTCRHVWLAAEACQREAGTGAVLIRFPPPGGEGEDTYEVARLVDDCTAGGKPPDLVILEVDAIPSRVGILPVLRMEKGRPETGAAWALVGLAGRDPSRQTEPIDTPVSGRIEGYLGSDGLRQFTGSTEGYWTDRGCSGSPLDLEARPGELAGMLCRSETGARAGEAPVRVAFVMPAKTIHWHLSLHVRRLVAAEHGKAADKVDELLEMIGAAGASVAEITDRLRTHFRRANAHAAEAQQPSNARVDAIIAEVRRLSAAADPREARSVLEHAITDAGGRLLPLLREKAAQQGLVFDHDGEIATLRQVAELVPENAWAWIELGDAGLRAGRRAEAKRAYERGFGAARQATDERTTGVCNNKIGDVLLLEGDRAGALASFRAGLAISERLAGRDPGHAEWQRDLSISHYNIGDVLLLEGDRVSSLASFRAGLAISERLAGHDPGHAQWQRDLSVSYNRIGDCQLLEGDRAGALASFRAGLAISKPLAGRDPGHAERQRDLSIGHNKIGDVLLLEGDRAGALASFRAGLAIIERLAGRDPGHAEWQRDLSISHDRIGDVLLLEGDRAGALASFRAGLAIRERLAGRDPGHAEWQRDLSISHNRMGDVLRLEGDLAGALASFRADLAISERLAGRDPGHAEWQRDLSVSHERIGHVLLLEGDRAGALASFRAGLAIHERLAGRDPGHAEWQRDLSISHNRIGDVLLREGDRAGALASFRADLAISERLAARDPGHVGWQRDLSVSHNRIGDVLLLDGDRVGALTSFRAGLGIIERLAARDPGHADWQRDLIVSCSKMADAEPDAARGWWQRALGIAKALDAAGRLAPADAWMILDLERKVRELLP